MNRRGLLRGLALAPVAGMAAASISPAGAEATLRLSAGRSRSTMSMRLHGAEGLIHFEADKVVLFTPVTIDGRHLVKNTI